MATIHYIFQTAAFDPERLYSMGEAFDLVRHARPDMPAEEIAAFIIAIAQTGVTETSKLVALTLDSVAAASSLRLSNGTLPSG